MDELRGRLLLAMGIVPVALQSCDAPVAVEPADGPGVAHRHDWLASVLSFDSHHDLRGIHPRLEVINESALYDEHVACLRLVDAAAEHEATIYAADASLPPRRREWTVVAEGIVGPDGTAPVRILGGLPDHERILLAASHDGRPEEAVPLELPRGAALWTDVPEIWPGTRERWLADGTTWRACVPKSVMTSCPEPGTMDRWRTLDVVAWALGSPLPADRDATVLGRVTWYPESCCYDVRISQSGPEPGDTGWTGSWDSGLVDTGLAGGWGWGGFMGRPFVTADGATLAPARQGAGWSRDAGLAGAPDEVDAALRQAIVEGWTARGLAEHASVASFARFALELMSCGAPADLLLRATVAQADEIRHAVDAFAVASWWAGQPVGVGAFPIDPGAVRSGDLAALVHAVVIEGCVEETIGAAQARAAADAARDPAVRALLTRVAEDETRHAELSWAFVRWALAAHPELRDVAAAAFAGHRLAPCADGPDLSAWGLLSPAAERRVALEVIERVVRPCAAALLAPAAEARA